VLGTRDGPAYVADGGGGVNQIHPDGGQARYLQTPANEELTPNGFALLADGSFLIADLGSEGGIWRLDRSGKRERYLATVDGERLPGSNFVYLDHRGRIWITVSTRKEPRALGYRKDCDDGYVILVKDPNRPEDATIVIDGLGFANEVCFDPEGRYLYANETFARRLSRFAVGADGTIGEQQVVATFGPGVYPDGLTFDVGGDAWITSILSNRVIRVRPDGKQTLIVEDADAAHLAWTEAAWEANALGRPHLDTLKSERLRNISSLAFSGPDRRTCLIGCLLGETIYAFQSETPGAPPAHWEFVF